MTQAERRIIAFLMTSNATEMADLPDWFLALVEGDGGPELSPELITAATLMIVQREHPGIAFGTAKRVLGDYADDPVKAKELTAKIHAFRLSCGFERLKRAGLYEDVSIGDPFDPDATVSVTLTEETWRFFNANPTKQDIHVYMQRRWGQN